MADYALPNFNFQVQWGEGKKTGFSKVRNLGISTEIIEGRIGNSKNHSDTTQPGQQVFENFILERPLMRGDNDFYDWWKSTFFFEEGEETGSIFRRTIVISLLNEKSEPIVEWVAKNAVPVRLSWSDLDAEGNSLMIERIEIATEGIELRHN